MNGNGGRNRNVTGGGSGIERRGSGLGTGPVGRPGGYQGRTGGGSGGGNGGGGGGNRGFNFGSGGGGGLGKIILIVIIAAVVLGGGFGIGNCSGLFSGNTPIDPGTGTGTTDIGSLIGGYTGFTPSTVSTGWVSNANTGTLNTSSSSGRSKYTVLKGNGQDKVTLMVYLCGTDLESKSGMASKDLQEMASATYSDNVHLLVYTGGTKQWKNSVISSSVNQIYEVRNGGLQKLVENDGSDAMTKPSTLTRFIQYCANKYPANRYGLVLWDHGGGSISGFGYDEKNSSAGSMNLSGISTALKNGGVKFDFVGYDACLMATLENGLMLDDYADYMIASEETEPGVGWYHTNWITQLSRNPSIPTPELGKIIIDDYTDFCAQKCSGQKTTLSIVDLGELSAKVPDALKTFAAKTTDMIQNNQYKTVSDARSSAREFSSNKIDQVDLVHFAYNLNTDSSKALANALLGAVKYNRTSSNMSNAYGISAYFPYRNSSKVNSGIGAAQSVGMDSEYIRCMQSFASLETGGQAAAATHTSSPLSSILGAFTGGGTSTSSEISGLLSGLLTNAGSSFFSSALNLDKATEYLTENQFDSSALVWTKADGVPQLKLSDGQWKQVQELQLNVFYDDGEGYIDLGCDNLYTISKEGALYGNVGDSWIAIDSQIVPYYYVDMLSEENGYVIHGRVPCLLNGDRAELLIVFDSQMKNGYISGARFIYSGGETETSAKAETELTPGDKIDFICDYYSYQGVYQDTFKFGQQMTYTGNHVVSDRTIDRSKTEPMYIFTDIYDNEFFSPVIPR